MGPVETSVYQHRIVDLFRVPGRYLRSAHLEHDFDDTVSLRDYVLTSPMIAVLARIIDGLRSGSGSRAWRITGDYGSGKSSFALMLAHLVRDPASTDLAHVREAVEDYIGRDLVDILTTPMIPVLVTGDREAIVPAVARAVAVSVEKLRSHRRQGLEALLKQSADVAESGEITQLLGLLDNLRHYSTRNGLSGVLVVIDELGKFLEYAALQPEREDLYVLQRIAELAARSADRPLVVLGLLHQGFHAYSERLPSVARLEWEKVAGRYEEITFDQALTHMATLIAGALNINNGMLPRPILASAQVVHASAMCTGWYGAVDDNSVELNPLGYYPLHPTMLPVLVRFFARFGQNERSLFGFLLSSEPFGLQSFANRQLSDKSWFRLSDLYDYARSAFGQRLEGGSYRSHWLRISDTIDMATDVDVHELNVLKTVAILNVIDAEHLLPTSTALTVAIADDDPDGVVAGAIDSLKSRGLLFDRGIAGGYCLWPNTSVNLEVALEAAHRALGSVERVSEHLQQFLEVTPLLARRHYIETGTLRHFEVRYSTPEDLNRATDKPTESDGIVVICLCDTEEDRRVAIEQVKTGPIPDCPEVIVAVPPAIQGIAPEVQDALYWQWVSDNTPELAQDSYGISEVARQIAASRRTLQQKIKILFGFQAAGSASVDWWHRGTLLCLPDRGGITAVLSTICDQLYVSAPLIRNELLNRRTLSTAAAAARIRLIDQIFSSPGERYVGIDPHKSPPEKSMYLSVLFAGKVHREVEGRFVLGEPPEDDDPLRLRPALLKIFNLLDVDDGGRVPVTHIFESLNQRPYGVRAGVSPLLLAIVVSAHSHEVAVYENGTFLPRLESSAFLRLIKQPESFEVQLCRVVGVRAEVFALLARLFEQVNPSDENPQLLDVVRPLSTFAAQLPEYTRRNSGLPNQAKDVRDALLSAREPSTLVFVDLPKSCGFDQFSADEPADTERAQQFVDSLQHAMSDLRATYPQLLERIRDKAFSSLGAGGVLPDRPQIAHRARRILLAAREPRLQTFARCLADEALPDDSWSERVGSFVVAKPPDRWTNADEAKALDEIDVLAGLFNRIDATAFLDGSQEPDLTATRLGLTNGDGSEAWKVVRVNSKDEPAIKQLVAEIEGVLSEASELKLAAITRVLWSNLVTDPETQHSASVASPISNESTGG